MQGFGMARALNINWLEPNNPNLTRVEDVNHVGKKLVWSVILKVLLQRLLQKHAKKLLKFRKASRTVTLKKCYTY